MLITHRLSEGTFGRVLSLRDDETNEVAVRPIGATVRVQPPPFDAGRIEIPHPIKEWAESGAKIVITLGERSADAITLPDDHPLANPLWARWLAEGRITDDLLADVPEPSDRVKAREIEAAKKAKLAEIEAAKKAADPHEQAKAAVLAATTDEEIANVKLP